MATLNNLTLRTLSDTVSLAKTVSDQRYQELLPYRLHQSALRTLKYFLQQHPAPAEADQTEAERALYQKVEHQLSYYVGEPE